MYKTVPRQIGTYGSGTLVWNTVGTYRYRYMFLHTVEDPFPQSSNIKFNLQWWNTDIPLGKFSVRLNSRYGTYCSVYPIW